MKTPRELDAFVDAVLSYKPKPKTKAAKKRIRKARREAKNQKRGVIYIIPLIDLVEDLEFQACKCDDREGFICNAHEPANKLKDAIKAIR